ncbi:MAG: T9SS type A sorting domain-containing protein [Bacteroidales bacterium]|nr:T9SS type A sorting domain-containing protein [Bacteroidales bacterium]
MKRITFLILVLFTLLCVNVLEAQINIGGNPVSYDFEVERLLEPLTFIQTPPLDMAIVEAEDARWEAERAAGMMKIGRRFGIEFEVEYGFHNSGTWSCLPDGGKLWRLGVECPDALSINLIFNKYQLPAGATLYIYSEDKRDKIGGFTDYNNQTDNFFATDVVLSDKIIIEYFQPVDADFDGELCLATIVHGYRGPGEFLRGFGQSGSCQRNTVCPESEGWEDQIRSVFALYSGGMELCSGCIVNNTADDGKPYALTANHCWDAAKNTGNWVFRFNWESPTCTPTTNTTYNAMSGATLRMRTPTNYSGTDCCLVELNQSIPPEWMVYYAGWSRSTEPSPFGMCIHHPSLDIKKISKSSKPLYTTTYSVQSWRADWFVGGACTEPGSSGSPLFDSNRRVIGQEYGGGSYCGAPSSQMFDVYGRFDISWNGSDSTNRLRDWLDPLELDSITWDGRYSQTIADAELLDIIEPEEVYYSIKTIEPTIKVKNSGTTVITSAEISYTINESAPVSKTWSGSLAGGATIEIVFDPITLTYGNHVFKASIIVDEDDNPANNEKSKNFGVHDCFSDDVLLQEDFEDNGLPPACWQNIAITGTAVWEFVTGENNGEQNPENPQSGSYNARFKTDAFGNKARLITPPMNLTDPSISQPMLVFWHAHAKCDNKQDGLRVYYKNAPNAAWKQITSFTDDVTSWKKETILLPEPSDFYWIAFEGLSGGGSGVLLDNVSVIQAPDVSVGELHNNSIKISPNPTSGEIQVTIAGQARNELQVTSIEVYDVMGRMVTPLNPPEGGRLPSFGGVGGGNLSPLPSGVYFIRIQTENGVITRKVVKK